MATPRIRIDDRLDAVSRDLAARTGAGRKREAPRRPRTPRPGWARSIGGITPAIMREALEQARFSSRRRQATLIGGRSPLFS